MAAGQTYPHVSDEVRNEVYERGQALYEKLKPQLLPQYDGQYVTIHVDAGDYEIASGMTAAARAMRKRHPLDGRLFSRKIGDKPDTSYYARLLASEDQHASNPK